MKIGVCQETARLWRRARHTAMLSRSWRFASMRTTSGRAAGARSRSSRPPPTETTRYPRGSSMLSSAWLSHVPEVARSTTGERVKGMRGANVVLSRSGGAAMNVLTALRRRTRQNPRYVREKTRSGNDQALPDGVADQARDVVDAQLLHHTRAVKFGGLGG